MAKKVKTKRKVDESESADLSPKVMKKEVKKEIKEKKVPVRLKPKFSLSDLQKEMDDFEVEIITHKNAEEVPCYVIPWKSLGLQFATGGILGGKFHEISGDSQTGKSYLLYELYSSVQEMGGVCLHQDGERALTSQIMKSCKIKDDGTFGLTHERDINKLFAILLKFVKAVRKKDKKCPILMGIDSFPSLQTTLALAEFDKGKDPKGYAAMQKNAAFSMAIEKFVSELDTYDATLILINQTRTKKGVVFGDPTYTLGEEVIKFWCTQRIQGRHVTKLKTLVKSSEKKEPIKQEVGIVVQWKAIKNRLTAPFQKVKVQTLFSKGILPYSGVIELLTNNNRISVMQSKEGKKTISTYVDKSNGEEFTNIVKLIEANPDIMRPIMIGEFDDEEAMVEDDESSETQSSDEE